MPPGNMLRRTQRQRRPAGPSLSVSWLSFLSEAQRRHRTAYRDGNHDRGDRSDGRETAVGTCGFRRMKTARFAEASFDQCQMTHPITYARGGKEEASTVRSILYGDVEGCGFPAAVIGSDGDLHRFGLERRKFFGISLQEQRILRSAGSALLCRKYIEKARIAACQGYERVAPGGAVQRSAVQSNLTACVELVQIRKLEARERAAIIGNGNGGDGIGDIDKEVLKEAWITDCIIRRLNADLYTPHIGGGCRFFNGDGSVLYCDVLFRGGGDIDAASVIDGDDLPLELRVGGLAESTERGSLQLDPFSVGDGVCAARRSAADGKSARDRPRCTA